MKEKKHNKKWLLSKGWKAYKGYKIENDIINSEGDVTYFESIKDFATKCVYYVNPNNEEEAYDDIDLAIERQEEYDEDNLIDKGGK